MYLLNRNVNLSRSNLAYARWQFEGTILWQIKFKVCGPNFGYFAVAAPRHRMPMLITIQMLIAHVDCLKTWAIQRGRFEIDPLSGELERRMHANTPAIDEKVSIHKRFANHREFIFLRDLGTKINVDRNRLVRQQCSKAVIRLNINKL